jgi:hypothetical protein
MVSEDRQPPAAYEAYRFGGKELLAADGPQITAFFDELHTRST